MTFKLRTLASKLNERPRVSGVSSKMNCYRGKSQLADVLVYIDRYDGLYWCRVTYSYVSQCITFLRLAQSYRKGRTSHSFGLATPAEFASRHPLVEQRLCTLR